MATAAAEELNALLNKHECFCLNESAAAPHANLFLEDDRLTLNSDADGNVPVGSRLCVMFPVCCLRALTGGL